VLSTSAFALVGFSSTMSSQPSTSLSSLQAEYDRSVSKCNRLKEELADKDQELSDMDHELALARRKLERADRKHTRELEELKDDFKRQRSLRPAEDEITHEHRSQCAVESSNPLWPASSPPFPENSSRPLVESPSGQEPATAQRVIEKTQMARETGPMNQVEHTGETAHQAETQSNSGEQQQTLASLLASRPR